MTESAAPPDLAGSAGSAGSADPARPPAGPPRAVQRPHRVEHHGTVLADPWHWLRDPAWPEVADPAVLAHLAAENAWFEAWMAPHRVDVEALWQELKDRQPDADAAVPWRDGDWYYQWQFAAGAQYRRWYRTPAAGGARTLLIDEVHEAAGHDYFQLGGIEPSPDGSRLAWSADLDGGERFTLRVRDLATGQDLDDTLASTSGAALWSADGQAIVYVVVNEAWRPWQVRLHRIGNPAADDAVLYEEHDESFFVGISASQSREWLFIEAGDHVTSEVRIVPVADPTATPRLVAPRRTGHEYDVDHGGGAFWIRSNAGHRNFALLRADPADPAEANWQVVLAGSDTVYRTGHAAFTGAVVVLERVDGIDEVRVLGADGSDHCIAFPEPVRSVGLGTNAEPDCAALRLGYTSMVSPDTVYDYDLGSRTLVVRKVRAVPGGYDPAQYATLRLMAPARDGARIPVSIVHRRDFRRDGHGPLHLYGYGAYGLGMEPGFSASRLALLDRGFACAIAHIRGGDELGYAWYEAGKLDRRDNTFNDFEDVARFLVAQGWTAPGRIAISGGSAGGELMGVVLNRAPELFGACVAQVPFVDVLNTMLDASLPLTPMEWPEWGNPIEDAAAFATIRAYSPYDNVRAQRYPPLLVTCGLNDPRVTYWEPAKWVARLREHATGDAPLLLKINMGAGHGGVSGRWAALHEVAEEFLFMLVALGVPVGRPVPVASAASVPPAAASPDG